MGFFKSLFGGSNTPETEKEKNDKKNFEILKYDGCLLYTSDAADD